MVSRDKVNSPILASIRHASVLTDNSTPRVKGPRIFGFTFAVRQATGMQAAWWERDRDSKRMCVVIHVRWGTGVPGERPGASRRSSPSRRDPHQTDIYIYVCMYCHSFKGEVSILGQTLWVWFVAQNCEGIHRCDPDGIRSPNESWRSAIMGICHRDDIRHVNSALSRFSRTRSRYIKNFDSALKLTYLWYNFLSQHEKK